MDASAELAPCDLVVEAIVEDLSAKQRLFADLEQIVRADAVLATNTSSLSVSAIAAACARPERVAGYHFFNPVPLMKLVEVIPGQHTAEPVVAALQELALRMGHRPVRATNSPGFLVNHAGRGYGTEALRILAEGVATPVEIDRILREAAGFRMGPFELFDLVGIDVAHAVMESIYRQFYDEPRFRPQPLIRRYVDAGLLGRKSGAGFYRYVDGRQEIPDGGAGAGRAAAPDLARRGRGGGSARAAGADRRRRASRSTKRRRLARHRSAWSRRSAAMRPMPRWRSSSIRRAPSRSIRCSALPAA